MLGGNRVLSGEDLWTTSNPVLRQYKCGLVVKEKSGFKCHWSSVLSYLGVTEVQICLQSVSEVDPG